MFFQSKTTGGRENNFNLLRIVAAGAVLVSHAYPISSGPETPEPLARVLGMTLGTLAVLTFFSISGYFISLSFHNRHSLIEFAVARGLRIYPGLLCVLVLTVFALGPAFTKAELTNYFLHRETLSYVPKNLFLWPLQYELPGVFDDNVYPSAINGSLWTLVYEVSCYGLVVAVGIFGLTFNGRRFGAFLVAYAVWYLATIPLLASNSAHHTVLRNLHELSLPFVMGMALFQFRHQVPLRFSLLALLAGASIISYGWPWFDQLFILAWSYGIFYVGFLRYEPLLAYNRLGDYSYGMYIYGFPVEQATAAVYSECTPAVMIAVSMPLTLLLAILSWHCVEKRALAQKSTVSAWLTRNVILKRFRPSRSQGGIFPMIKSDTRGGRAQEMDYYHFVRREIKPILPKNPTRILEVGAGAGGTLKWLKALYPKAETTAVELNPDLRDELQRNVDVVFIGPIEDTLPKLKTYDLILLLDVLEHLPDSTATLRKLSKLLVAGGHVIVSVPNIAHLSVSVPLLLKRRFNYQDAGIMDRTHLRFFVEETAIKLLNDANFIVTGALVSGIQGRRAKVLDLLSFGLLRHHLTKQYIMLGQLSDHEIVQEKVQWTVAR